MDPEKFEEFAVVPALELIRVAVPSLRDPSAVVLEEVNWTVQEGDYWAVAGLQRSGKSDLVATAAGLVQPARGTIRVFGKDEFELERDRLALRRRVGLVFDGGQLLHHLTLAENIALPLYYHEDPENPVGDDFIEALIAFTEVEAWAGRHPAEVSWNWRQRVGLARALALRPDILLLDGPLIGLDPHDAGWWLEKMDALHRGHPVTGGRQLTIVGTGDDLRPWRDRATEFAVLRAGRFVHVGNRASLGNHPERLVQELLPANSART